MAQERLVTNVLALCYDFYSVYIIVLFIILGYKSHRTKSVRWLFLYLMPNNFLAFS